MSEKTYITNIKYYITIQLGAVCFLHLTLIQHFLERQMTFSVRCFLNQSVFFPVISDKMVRPFTFSISVEIKSDWESDLKKPHPNSSFLLLLHLRDSTFFLPSVVVSICIAVVVVSGTAFFCVAGTGLSVSSV